MRVRPLWPADAPVTVPGGHLIPRDSVVGRLASTDADAILWVGHGTTCGAINHAGGVMVARGCRVEGPIRGGHEVLVGAHCRVAGRVEADGRVVVQAGTRIDGNIRAGGDVFLLGDSVVGEVEAGGDIVVVGAPRTGRLLPAGRVAGRLF